MAVKMRKWSPWQAAARKFQVAVKYMKLDGLIEGGGGDEKFVAIKIKWKGEPRFFQLRQKKELSIVKKGCGVVEWDEDHVFENTCWFSVVSDHRESKFGPWEISFNVLCGEKKESKAKMEVIGRVSINISEIACKIESSSIEQKLPLSLQIDGFARNAILTVVFNFVEIREPQDSVATSRGITPKSSEVKGVSGNECKENTKARRRSLSLEEANLDESGELSVLETNDATQPKGTYSEKKERWFAWKSRRFSFKREEKPGESTEGSGNEKRIDGETHPTVSLDSFNAQKDDPTKPSLGSEYQDDAWQEKELTSRDGQAKLKSSVFFASFDQRSDKAAGESACTALVAVISHWLHSNSDAMPNRLEFYNLIMQGSSEWRKLCEDIAYVNDFPNKHFDLETILRADIRPISISHNKSYVGFFGAETFEALKGAMSFDDIWNEISTGDDSRPRVYIVSWNDHFFVLKAESNAYYIIDTLGERLHEGCCQAYILRFDDKTLMLKQNADQQASKNHNIEEKLDEEIICSGKECCKEFIKRFLAAIPLKELEDEEEKKAVSYFSIHQRLQIEFNYSCLISPLSSLTSSPPSSPTTSASSPFSE